MPEVMFYNRPEVLDRNKHAKLRFTPLNGYQFAAKVTHVPLVAAEFAFACRRYPIAFVEDNEGNVRCHAILSLVQEGNSFVDEKGQWLATYVPAFVRRYPFILADMPNNAKDFAVAVDMDSGCFTEDKGEALFDDKGEAATLLKNQVEFLSNFHKENLRTLELTKLLKTEDLLTPLNLDITRAADNAKFGVRGLTVVDEKKLTALSAEKAGKYLANGLLAIVYMHLVSLRNFETLANRAGQTPDSQIPWWAR